MIKRFLPILILAASPTVADELTGYDICNRSEVVVVSEIGHYIRGFAIPQVIR